MSKLKKIFGNWRMIIFISFFILTLIAINPDPFNKGVAIRTVVFNSSAYAGQMHSAAPTDSPMLRERIVEVNRISVNSVVEFENVLDVTPKNTTMTIKTEKSTLGMLSTLLGLQRAERTYVMHYTSKENLGLKVYEAPKSNIILGLDLQGGTRVVLEPEVKLPKEDVDLLVENMKQRLDVFGLTDTVIRSSSDLAGNQFIIVEIAGASEEEVKDLLAKQGKFEAKIG